LRDADLPGFGERFAQLRVGFASALVRFEIVGLFKIEGRDLGFVNEFLDLDGGGISPVPLPLTRHPRSVEEGPEEGSRGGVASIQRTKETSIQPND
jgi:hypothetical protein